MEIKYPQQTTYFICKNNDLQITGYGQVEPDQIMNTNQPNVDIYLNRVEWESVLLEHGIVLEEDEE